MRREGILHLCKHLGSKYMFNKSLCNVKIWEVEGRGIGSLTVTSTHNWFLKVPRLQMFLVEKSYIHLLDCLSWMKCYLIYLKQGIALYIYYLFIVASEMNRCLGEVIDFTRWIEFALYIKQEDAMNCQILASHAEKYTLTTKQHVLSLCFLWIVVAGTQCSFKLSQFLG